MGAPVAQGAESRTSRILVVTSIYPTTDRPEAGVFVMRRVRAMRERGVKVEVISPPNYRMSGLRRHLWMLAAVFRPRPRPDGVEGHVLFVAGLIALVAARRYRCPLVIYAHGHDVRVTAQKTLVHRLLSRWVAAGANAVVTNSSATATFVQRLGVPALVISPGVDFSTFRPGDQRAARAQLGLPAGALIALYVGTLSPGKGADLFVEALADGTGWTGVMGGGGELDATIRAQRPGIQLIGVLPPGAIAQWMLAADVLVMPSRQEALGLAAIEALGSGIPVVASRTGGLAEVVQDGRNGILVTPGSVAEIRAALERLADPIVRARFAAQAQTSVAAHDMGIATEAMAGVWGRLGVRA